MKATWLGQAGLLLDNGRVKMMIDPYLSESVRKVHAENARRMPIREEIFAIEPDVMIFTHDHLDHYDPDTAPRFLGNERKPMTVLCPSSVWPKARKNGSVHNYVLLDRGSEWTEGNVRVRAVKAAHSDPYAIGVVVEDLDEGRVYYITGDTLYNREIFSELPSEIDVVFLPINGVGNNMNVIDAQRFARDCSAKRAFPYHVGMFDDLTPELFEGEGRILPKLYEEIEV